MISISNLILGLAVMTATPYSGNRNFGNNMSYNHSLVLNTNTAQDVKEYQDFLITASNIGTDYLYNGEDPFSSSNVISFDVLISKDAVVDYSYPLLTEYISYKHNYNRNYTITDYSYIWTTDLFFSWQGNRLFVGLKEMCYKSNSDINKSMGSQYALRLINNSTTSYSTLASDYSAVDFSSSQGSHGETYFYTYTEKVYSLYLLEGQRFTLAFQKSCNFATWYYSQEEIGNIINENYQTGFNNGYNTGYTEGMNSGSQSDMNPLLMAFNGVGDILNMELFPNFKLWYLLGIPLILSLIFLILKAFH